jgi:hypothetical protein
LHGVIHTGMVYQRDLQALILQDRGDATEVVPLNGGMDQKCCNPFFRYLVVFLKKWVVKPTQFYLYN